MPDGTYKIIQGLESKYPKGLLKYW